MISETVDTTLDGLLQGIVDDSVEDRYSVLADYLEEYDDPRRAELLRLHRKLLNTCCEEIDHSERATWHSRIVELIEIGVVPCVPQQRVRVDGVEMILNFIPPGSFLMGSHPKEEGRFDWEDMQHWMIMAKGFYLAAYLVTQKQWQAVMGTNPSRFKGGAWPVERVTWNDCREFCRKLSDRDSKCYRLPTEAEWEYACRAGTTTPFHFGEMISTDRVNYNGSHNYGKLKKGIYREQTTPVDSFPPNAWGLYDMHGNVLEWCQDQHGPDHQGNIRDDIEDSYRVIRGGSWGNGPRICRSAYRGRYATYVRSSILGFRVVMDI